MDEILNHRWSADEIVEVVADGLHHRAKDDDLEQAVYGFDHLDELGLHPLVQQPLSDAGYGVWPEQMYPDDWSKDKRSEARRCDVVLTAPPGDRPLREPLVKGTLFDTDHAVDVDQAYWLEIKTVAQFETSGPFQRYSSELFSPVADDVKKLWADGVIRYAGLLLVLFTLDQPTAEHDLFAWHDRCVQKGLPVVSPVVRGFQITDRIGNGYCSVALFGVRGV